MNPFPSINIHVCNAVTLTILDGLISLLHFWSIHLKIISEKALFNGLLFS